MNQIMKESTREVKTQTAKTQPRRSRITDFVPNRLAKISNEQCYDVLRSIGRIEHYPAHLLTHPEEVARFFGVEKPFWQAFRAFIHRVAKSKDYGEDFPIMGFTAFFNQIKDKSGMMGIEYQYCVDANGIYYFSLDSNPQHMVKFGNPQRTGKGIKLVSMRGIMFLAFYLASHPKFQTPVTQEIVRRFKNLEVREGMSVKEDETPTIPEPTPASAPKLDPTQTLTQMFQAMLTLLTKESEERGAEKLIQKLKEEGKL